MWLVPIGPLCRVFRSNKLTIGVTNGCFDILHEGHLHLLRHANVSCNILIVALNSDISVNKLKNGNRPINNYKKRAAALSATGLADFVFEFDTEDDLTSLMREVRPDVLIKGSDYTGKKITGSQYAKKTLLVPLLPGFSTTRLA